MEKAQGSKRALRAPFRHRDFRYVVAGLTISQTGDWLYNVALLVFVLRATHSPAWVAAAGIVRLLPYVVLGSFGGVIGDRYSRKMVMIVSDIARAGVMGMLTWVAAETGSAPAAVALAGFSTCFAVAYGPSVNAATPVLVTEDELAAANSIITSITNVCIALGPAVGGVLLLLGSPSIAFAFNAVTFLGSALMVAMVKSDLGPERRSSETGPEDQPGFVARLREGMAAILSSADVVVLVAAWTANAFLYGLEIVMLALIATRRLGIGDNGLAFLYAALGVGGVLAIGIAHRVADRPRQAFMLAACTIVPGLAFVGFAFTRSPAAGYALAAADGGASIVLDVLIVTSLQRLLGNEVLGRAFGAIDSLVVGGMLLGSLVAPPLVRIAGLQGGIVVGGVLVALAGLVVLQRARSIDRRVASRVEELAPRVSIIEDLDLFEGASRATLEALASAMAEERVHAGDVVIREGDEPDDLFVATAGQLVVTAEGRGVVGELDAGDYFGEIGLLHRVKRTATVTAQTDCALFRMSGETFLRLIAEGVAQSSSLVHNMQSRLAITRSGASEEPSPS